MALYDYDDDFHCDVYECNDCKDRKGRYLFTQESLYSILDIIYSDQEIDNAKLEAIMDDLCSTFDVDVPKGTLNLSRKKKMPFYIEAHVNNLREILA